MKRLYLPQAIALSLGALGTVAHASDTNVTVTIEILSPTNGTAQSPHWVGFHDGTFDLYDSGSPANALPIKGSRGLEQLAEDGDNSGIESDFQVLQPAGVDASIFGENGDLVPGEIASMSFTLDSASPANRYFSYGSMVLPSNDFFYANDNPRALPVFDDNGNFIPRTFIVANTSVRDAGTEENDELPENTAFFGQTVNDSGMDEDGVITNFSDSPKVRFRPANDGGNILSDPRFAMADFGIRNYTLTRISLSAEPQVTFDDTTIGERLTFSSDLGANNTVPLSAVKTSATGNSAFILNRNGKRIRFGVAFFELKGVTAVNLHLGREGETGPVVASLLPDNFDVDDGRQQQSVSEALKGSLFSNDLSGPLKGLNVSALARQILDGNVYINVVTELNPTGEIRGQLAAE